MDAKKDKVAKIVYAYNKSLGTKKYLPIIFFVVAIVLIIPLYVEVFKSDNSIKETLFLATEDQQMALTVTNTFTNFLTYYPKKSGKITGNFSITTTLPTSLNLRVVNSSGIDITNGVTLATSKANPSIVYFSNSSGGAISLQYTNTSATNYITRVDVRID